VGADHVTVTPVPAESKVIETEVTEGANRDLNVEKSAVNVAMVLDALASAADN
jgi:hypothetical protein